MIAHSVQWVTASPLWARATGGPDPSPLRRPALLRMASDSFMDDLRHRLADDPASLFELEAAPASFRARPLGEPDTWTAPRPDRLKLYQPFHGHFNLVAASLVCGLPGLPDRVVDRARRESVGFVLRRLLADGSELAWAEDPAQGKGWVPLPVGAATLPIEERLPMFPVNFVADGRRRRLHVGLIPTSSVDVLRVAPELSPSEVAASEADPRIDEADARIFDVLRALLKAQVPAAQAREASLFLLLDLADFLARREPALWQAIRDGQRPAVGVRGRGLYDRLGAWRIGQGAGATPWREALRLVFDQRRRIVVDGTTSPELPFDLRATRTGGDDQPLAQAPGRVDLMRADLIAALGPIAGSTSLTVPVGKLEQGDEASYVVRCVFDRPGCEPYRGPIVGAPSVPFALAGVFDLDAPARSIRIVMPVDTSPAGLRKFPKNVAVVMSEQLRRQANAASNLQKLLNGDGSGGGFDLGLICSFSIPVITICALIVLFIFLSLLNIIFWWLPFVRICWPIPKPARPT